MSTRAAALAAPLCLAAALCAAPGGGHAREAAERTVSIGTADGERVAIARLSLAEGGRYALALEGSAFEDHFLSMRPFRCMPAGARLLCHVPYPYENARDLSGGAEDLEYDLLFVWKDAGDYGIDLWNGLYWRLDPAEGGGWTGRLHEVDLGRLAAPPPAGQMRPIRPGHLEPAEPGGHPFDRLWIE